MRHAQRPLRMWPRGTTAAACRRHGVDGVLCAGVRRVQFVGPGASTDEFARCGWLAPCHGAIDTYLVAQRRCPPDVHRVVALAGGRVGR